MEIHPLWLIGISVVLAMIPIIIGGATSYLKVSIVLGLVRNALGTQQIPGPMIISALSLTLSMYIMGPTFHLMQERIGSVPQDFAKKGLTKETIMLVSNVFEPLRGFLQLHSGEREVAMLENLRLSNGDVVEDQPGEKMKDTSLDWSIVIPAFMLSELKDAFTMGFIVLLPFLVIDLIVANILTGMGMYMMSPMTISLPLKLILFTSSDVWILIVRGLVHSYER